jgi:hypothetical protein
MIKIKVLVEERAEKMMLLFEFATPPQDGTQAEQELARNYMMPIHQFLQDAKRAMGGLATQFGADDQQHNSGRASYPIALEEMLNKLFRVIAKCAMAAEKAGENEVRIPLAVLEDLIRPILTMLVSERRVREDGNQSGTGKAGLECDAAQSQPLKPGTEEGTVPWQTR